MFMDINSMMPYERTCGSHDSVPSCGCRDNGGNARMENGGITGNCGTYTCGNTWGLKNYPLASVYAPIQNFEELYELDVALKQGTVFSKLDPPFLGESVYKGGGCRG